VIVIVDGERRNKKEWTKKVGGLYVFRGNVRFREQTAPPTLIYNICDPLVPTRPQRSTCNAILQRLSTPVTQENGRAASLIEWRMRVLHKVKRRRERKKKDNTSEYSTSPPKGAACENITLSRQAGREGKEEYQPHNATQTASITTYESPSTTRSSSEFSFLQSFAVLQFSHWRRMAR
jgi:hypothetical protein